MNDRVKQVLEDPDLTQDEKAAKLLELGVITQNDVDFLKGLNSKLEETE
jgi:hypothetical protein